MRLARLLGLALSLLALAAPAALRADYKGAIVMDAATGNVLYEENADAVGPPASVTKLMTFLVVHDAIAAGRLTLATPVTANATDQSMGGTQVNLAAGETFPVEELLHAVMVESANDAAHALAIPTAGSREAFVAAMNARARSLGMSNTTFRTPHGLPPSTRNISDGDLTTPRDLARLALELVTHTDVLRYSSIRTRPFGAGVRPEPLPMRNHNKLLSSVEGCDGLKTGFTRSAGFCLAATAQRDGKRIIVAVMGSPDAKTRDARVTDLINTWFPKLPASSVFTGGPATSVAPVSATPVSPTTDPEKTEEAPPVFFKVPKR